MRRALSSLFTSDDFVRGDSLQGMQLNRIRLVNADESILDPSAACEGHLEPEEEQDESVELYEVEEILDRRYSSGVVEYMVRWKGYAETTCGFSYSMPSCEYS